VTHNSTRSDAAYRSCFGATSSALLPDFCHFRKTHSAAGHTETYSFKAQVNTALLLTHTPCNF